MPGATSSTGPLAGEARLVAHYQHGHDGGEKETQSGNYRIRFINAEP